MSEKARFGKTIPVSAVSFILFLLISPYLYSQSSFTGDTSAIRKILNQADELYQKEDDVKSLQLAKNAFEASKMIKFIEGEAIAGKYIARVYANQFQFDSAVSYYTNSQKLFKELGMKREFYNIYNNLGVIYGRQSDYIRSRKNFKLAYQGAIEVNDMDMIFDASQNLVIVYRYLGLWDSCFYIISESEKKALEVADSAMLADCYRERAIIYEEQGKYKPALDNYYRFLNYYESKNIKHEILMAKADIAAIYLNIHEYQKALELLRNVMDEYDVDFEGYTDMLSSLGMAYQGVGEMDSAMLYHTKCLESAKAHNIRRHIALSYYQIGRIYNGKKEYPKAFEALSRSIALYSELQMKQQYAEAIAALGDTYLATGKTEKAHTNYLEAYAIGKELNALSVLRSATHGLHQVMALKNNYKEAYYYALKFKAYNDSSLNIENVKNATKTELEYAFEKEKAEIDFQHKQDELLQEGKIKQQKMFKNSIFVVLLLTIVAAFITYRFYLRKKKADQEKEALLKEIHHRVKNNLQIISSLLSIQTKSITDTKVISAVQESQGRVKAMALIHQLLYQNKDLSRINFGTYLPQLVHALSSIYKKEDSEVDYAIEAETISFDIDLAIPLGLIVTELTANAFKYAFNGKEKGMLSIKIDKTSHNEYQLTMADNGPGLPQGIKVDELNSMGLRLVKILTDQLDGTFEYKYNQGAIFIVQFASA